MGIRKEEEYFPRGRSSNSKPALRKAKDSLFKKYKNPKKRVKKTQFHEEKQKKEGPKKNTPIKQPDIVKHVIRPLTYQSLEEGLVVVGRVREIWQYHMFICLPGRLSAKVPVTAISTPYTESLARLQDSETDENKCLSLSDLFRVGQSVVCSVVDVKKEVGVLAVSVSLEPSLVNKQRAHHTLRAGYTLVAAVRSLEDHGYTLHTGISSLTAFLPRPNTERYVQLHNLGRPLVVGELVRCVVTKCRTARSATRVEVTLDPDIVARPQLANITSQFLHPAISVTCTVDQVFGSGLVVAVGGGGVTAYVEAAQLTDCWSSPKQYKRGTELTASVLYVLPHSDFQKSSRPVYLTLKDINECVTPKIALGETKEAIVTFSSPKGVYLCLGDQKDNELGNKGFVSIRRLGENIVKENIAIKFPKGKIVTTRILAFDYVEQVYNCTLERDKLQQQYVKAEQLAVGDRVSCQVSEVEGNGLKLSIGPVRLYAFKEHTADVPYLNLYQYFNVGDIVDARVLKVSPEGRQVSVTLKETLIRSPALSSYAAAQLNDCYWGTVRHVRDNSLYVTFYNDVSGTVNLSGSHQPFSPGQLVKCYVTYVNLQEHKLLLSLTPKTAKQPAQLTVGQMYQLVVDSVTADHLTVSACDYDSVGGIVPKVHLRDRNAFVEGDFLKAYLYQKKAGVHHFSPNIAIRDFLKVEDNMKPHTKLTCCVAKVDAKKISVHTPLPQFPIVDVPKKKLANDEDVEVHQILRLYVKEFDPSRKFLVLTGKKPTTPGPGEPSDAEMESNVEHSNDETNSFSNNLKASSAKKVKKEQNNQLKTHNHAGQKVNENALSKIDTYNSSRKQKNSLSDESIDNPIATLNKTKTSKKKRKKDEDETPTEIPPSKKIKQSDAKEREHSLSQQGKGQISEHELVTNQKINNKDKHNLHGDKTKVELSRMGVEVSKIDAKTKPLIGQSSESVEDSENNSDSNIKLKKPKKNTSKKSNEKNSKKLTLSETGFLWDVKPEDLNKPVEEQKEDTDEEIEDTNKGKKKKTVAERRRAAKEEEARLREVEQGLLDSETNPQSVDQFDRAVLARPDDADLWIKYMSHHLQATEIEKARAVARRALQTINQRHEVERLNVWIALLNLEHLFGTQESLKNSMDEALRTNDEFTVYCKMLQIYSQGKKSQEAEQLVNTMLRKFRSSAACWVHSCSALMQCDLADKARSLLQRAISALPTKEHINLLCKFALLENQYGFDEQAQTLFEHILTSYPKRTDIWNVYVDMLVKSDKIKVARQLLERATRQKLPARKMKMLFSKWISFEEKHGTAEKVDYVKKQAVAYVNNVTVKLE